MRSERRGDPLRAEEEWKEEEEVRLTRRACFPNLVFILGGKRRRRQKTTSRKGGNA